MNHYNKASGRFEKYFAEWLETEMWDFEFLGTVEQIRNNDERYPQEIIIMNTHYVI